jgi:membrane protease YdiL (CAAX protease family)
MTFRLWWLRTGTVLVGLLIALGLPELPLKAYLASDQTMLGHVEREIYFWSVTTLLLFYVLLIERRGLSSIGLRLPNGKSLGFGVAVAVLLVAWIVFAFSVLFPLLHLEMNAKAMNQLLQTPLWFRFLLVVRAAVFEEICYRGYTIERIEELTGSRTAAFVVSVVAFTYAHVSYWGWTQLIIVVFGGVLLTAYYMWRRDLASNMIAHFLADGAGFLFGGAG